MENIKLFSQGGADIFVVQYDSRWKYHLDILCTGGPSEDWANDCEIDNDGIIHVVGLMEETVSIWYN